MGVRNVRNFWVDVNIDGYKTDLSGGPQGKDGGIGGSIMIRDRGQAKKAVSISGGVWDGKISLRIAVGDGIDFRRCADGSIVIETLRDEPAVPKVKKVKAVAPDPVAVSLKQVSETAKRKGF